MPKGYNHLTQLVRCQIQAYKSMGLSNKAIADNLNVHPSTISRELSRNTGKRGYRHQQAQTLAEYRRKQASSRPKVMTLENIAIIESHLEKKWSPEQISGRLKLENNLSVSHVTIYQHMYADRRNGGTLYKHLRHKGKKYNRRSKGTAGRGHIPNRVDISQRPSVVEEKSRIGDWEGDLIIGANHQGALLTLVDRASKFTIIRKLLGKNANEVVEAIKSCLGYIKRQVLSITFDNGKEFSLHEQIAKMLKAKIYFATPYHSWERGLNEFTNGLIRQYLPKSTNMLLVTDDNVNFVQNALNNRPRKVLNFQTPREVFLKSLKPSERIALRGWCATKVHLH